MYGIRNDKSSGGTEPAESMSLMYVNVALFLFIIDLRELYLFCIKNKINSLLTWCRRSDRLIV